MPIDDFIEQLQEMKKLHGEFEVAINNRDEGGEDNWEVPGLKWHDETETLEVW